MATRKQVGTKSKVKKPAAKAVKAPKTITKLSKSVTKTKSGALTTVLDTSIKNDRSVEIRGSVALTATTVAQVQRALLLQSLAKDGDTSSVKFYLGPSESNRYRLQDQAALADTMITVSKPVDVIVRSGLAPDVLNAFLSATGKRYMLAGATLHLGVVTNNAPYGKNKASQVRRQLFNDYKSDLQTLVMLKTGETDRSKVYKDLLSARGYNAIEALYYGKTGLIDGILMGIDRIITRADLDIYYKQQKMSADQIEQFNKHYINVYKLPTRSLKATAPQSIPDGQTSYYVSLKKPQPEAAKVGVKGKAKPKPVPEVRKPVFYMGEKKLDELPVLIRASKDKSPARMFIDNPPSDANGILDDDVIFFNDGFRDETAEQIVDGLMALDHKKMQQARHQKISHIKIVENSPGGSVWSGQELRSLIKSLNTPVDVIVQGMGASCGSWLLCSATGNRFATPQARIMFHEAANELRQQTPHDHFNEMLDGLDQATLDYIAIVAHAVGRKFEDVLRDFDNDVWLNPVESLFYGDKGLIDAILVGHDRIITRQDVEKYLLKKLGSKSKLALYVETKIDEKRDPRLGMEWKPERHNEDDPFDNPLKTIAAVVKLGTSRLTDTAQFAGSAPHIPKPALKGKKSVKKTDTERSLDFFNVVVDEEKK